MERSSKGAQQWEVAERISGEKGREDGALGLVWELEEDGGEVREGEEFLVGHFQPRGAEEQEKRELGDVPAGS